MTKSTITRERIELIANFHRAMTLPPSHDEIEELARMALAAMDSEPVAEVCEDYAIRYISSGSAPKEGLHPGDKLYRYAQPAPERYSMFDVVASILDGIDRTELEDGWWETSAGAESGRETLEKIRAAMLNGGKS